MDLVLANAQIMSITLARFKQMSKLIALILIKMLILQPPAIIQRLAIKAMYHLSVWLVVQMKRVSKP